MEGFIGNDLAWTVPFIGYLGLLHAYYWPLTYRMLKLDAEAASYIVFTFTKSMSNVSVLSVMFCYISN